MNFLSDVRFTTTLDGFEIVRKYIDEVSDLGSEHLLNESICFVKNEEKKYVILGWDNIMWQYDNKIVIAFKEAIHFLKTHSISYSFIRIGKGELYDIRMDSYYGKDAINLPYINVSRSFTITDRDTEHEIDIK